MRLAIVGYGKMGRMIETLAVERGNTISKIIDLKNAAEIHEITPANTDAAIEFTAPEAAFANVMALLRNKVPVVSGSTGWLDRKPEIEKYCEEHGTTFFYASNFSLGVNVFFKVNEFLARLMSGRGYKTSVEDIHHIHKLDAPSGTGITIAEGIIANTEGLSSWAAGDEAGETELPIVSRREGEVPGTHSVLYASDIDDIKITHQAHTRKGFALGAVLVGEWLADKEGVLSMNDFFDF